MDEINFTDDEIRDELEKLGYCNVPTERIREFKRDLENLIQVERSASVSLCTTRSDESDTYTANTRHHTRTETRQHLDSDERSSMQHVPAGSTNLKGPTYDPDNGRENLGHIEAINAPQTGFLKWIEPNRPRTAPASNSEAPLKSCLKKLSYVPYVDDIENRPAVHSQGFGEEFPRSDSEESSCVLTINTSRDSSASTGGQQAWRRKVSRKRNDGHIEIYSRSVAETDSDVSSVENHMRNLHLKDAYCRPMSAPPKVTTSNRTDHHSHAACREHLSYNLPEGYQGPKALIRPMSCEPHMKNVCKDDPVSRYHNYRLRWAACKAPGERPHSQLRHDIREQMLHQDQVIFKKPHPVHRPNSYVVPSDKKRKTLRWQIRNDLARGIKPPSVFD